MRSVVSRCRWCSPDVEVGEYHSEDTALAAAAAAPSSLQHRVVGNDLYNYITLPYTYSPACAPRHRDETTSSTDTPPLLRFSAPRRSRYTANPPPLPPLARTDRSHNFAPPPPRHWYTHFRQTSSLSRSQRHIEPEPILPAPASQCAYCAQDCAHHPLYPAPPSAQAWRCL